MSYLLDTDTCVALIKGKPQPMTHLAKLSPAQIVVSTVTLAELQYGARKSQYVERNLELVQRFLDPFALIPFDAMAAREYGVIRADLERRGTPIGPNDLKIASIARGLGFTLVTHNTREFDRVTGLKLADWLA